jgi:hypothetical protein
LFALELVLDVYNSGDPQWAQWATSFYEQHNDYAFIAPEVLQSVIDRHDLHSAVSAAHTPPSHSTGKHVRDHTAAVNMIEELIAKACASCGKHFKPKVAQHKMCDGCFSRCDKKVIGRHISHHDAICSGELQTAPQIQVSEKECQALVFQKERCFLLFWPTF